MKERVQAFGRFLSGMVMPNMGAFIAWGLAMALFMPAGWLPNETLNALATSMSMVLLPLLIAYTGGAAVYGRRGGVIGSIASMGVILGSDIPMIMGVMLVGPVCAWMMKKFDHLIEGKIPAGFEMLVNNFSLGIIGLLLGIGALKGVVPAVDGINHVMRAGVGFFVDHRLLPLTSVLIEPAKVLFLNNAINHGILSPMGMQQAEETGKSVFFLLEADPGPGLGILLAYCMVGKGSARRSAPGAVIIHFFGGIHEIYFPYILMNPPLILAVVAGGGTGVFIFQLLGAGLTSPASPGSILAILAMTPRGDYIPVLAGIMAAAFITFTLALPILKYGSRNTDIQLTGKEELICMENNTKCIEKADAGKTAGGAAPKDIKKIVFACDAGMGSSAMGAAVFKKKLAAAQLGGIEVCHFPVSMIPRDAQIVITHKELGARASRSNTRAELILITNFLAAPEYDQLIEELKKGYKKNE